MAQVTPDCGLASEIPLPRLLGKPTEYKDVLVVFYTWSAVMEARQGVGSRGNEPVGTGRAAINALATDGSRSKEWEACKSEALQGEVRSGLLAADI
ncbi:hypothetical protein GQ607_016208 [Colletotrichum asianum]|uniref:Uncharacterized protein n=1 Tax=Colletotrichum asianum TaxID=702518 RepID=A0A8H3W1H2_9PEZI|nr:hypothetical protein GQ607_016208 [Colletotrichum asianum]